VRVIHLLRKGPGVAFYNHWQTHADRFTNAAGTGLTDEEISQTHVVRDALRKAVDNFPAARFKFFQPAAHLLIVSAKKDHLHIHLARVAQALGDGLHRI